MNFIQRIVNPSASWTAAGSVAPRRLRTFAAPLKLAPTRAPEGGVAAALCRRTPSLSLALLVAHLWLIAKAKGGR